MRTLKHLLLPPLLACFAWPVNLSAQDASQPFRWEGVERVVAIADIHGAWDAFVSLLRGTALVDEDLAWRGGEDHLVIVGDILDRGADSRRVLDLVMRLEREAAAAGGAVHMVLGNHEVMNLVGELAYVSAGEFSSYADQENAGERRRAQSRFSAANPGLTRLNLRPAFNRRYPRGFFGHRAAFAADGVYGEWLLRQPVLLVVNDTAFVHAGLSASLIGEGLEEINTRAAAALRRYLEDMRVLLEARALFPESDFHEHEALAARARGNDAVDEAAASIVNFHRDPLFADEGPLWYRGMVDCSPAIEQPRLRRALNALGVERLVIGHTPTNNHLVQERFGEALLMADTGMLNAYYGGRPAAIVFEGGAIAVHYPENASLNVPVPAPRTIGPRVFGLADADLEDLLASADVDGRRVLPDGRFQLRMRHATGTFDALFVPSPDPGAGFVPEVAAYRVDRLLGLDLVPVAVRREVEGQPGALLLDASGLPPADALEEGAGEPWCPLNDQRQLAAVFDFLVNKVERGQWRYMESSVKLVLSDNHAILAPGAAPGPVPSLAVAPGLADALRALSPESLAAALGDVLDEARRLALLQRRDALLEDSRR